MKDRIAPPLKHLTLLNESSDFSEPNEVEENDTSSTETIEDSLDTGDSSEPGEGTEAAFEFQVAFNPPLYRQRYLKVCELLKDERWMLAINRVVEFGCT